MKLGEKLTEGPIFKKFVLFVIPVIITSFLQQMYNAVDAVVVGHFADKNALAAVGSTSSISALIITLFMGMSVGTNVVCAGFFGADNKQALENTLHTSILLGIIFGIPLLLVGWLGAEYFLTLTGTPTEVLDQAALYMKIYFLGIPASLIYNFGSAALRAVGDTKRPLYILSVSGIANVVVNIICVAFLNMGVVGVALGTIVAQIISAVWVVCIFMKSDGPLHFEFKKLRVYKKEFLRIISIGIPAGLNGIMFSLSGVIIQKAINSFGETTIAAHSVAWNYMAFSNLLVAAGEQGVVSFVGQNMGARKFDRVRKTVKIALGTMTVASIIFSLIIVVFAKPLMGFFTPDAGVVRCGLYQIKYSISVYFLYVPALIFGAALRGMGKSIVPTVINLICICLFRVLWIWFVWGMNKSSLALVYYSFPFTWVTSGLAMAVAYYIEKKRVLHN